MTAAWAWEGSQVAPVGRTVAQAGRVIPVMDTLAAIPSASNMVPVQLPAHSVNGQFGLSFERRIYENCKSRTYII